MKSIFSQSLNIPVESCQRLSLGWMGDCGLLVATARYTSSFMVALWLEIVRTRVAMLGHLTTAATSQQLWLQCR